MDPIANFRMMMDNEDRVVDHIMMKQWEEKVEKAKAREEKLIECLVEMTGCSKKDARHYANPGYHPIPENVRLKEAKEELKQHQLLYDRERKSHQETDNHKHYYFYISDMLINHAKKDPDWDQDKFAEFEKEMNKKYLQGEG